MEKAAVRSDSYFGVRAALASDTPAQARTSSSEPSIDPRGAKYGIPHNLSSSYQPRPQAFLEAPKTQEAASQPSVAGTAQQKSEIEKENALEKHLQRPDLNALQSSLVSLLP